MKTSYRIAATVYILVWVLLLLTTFLSCSTKKTVVDTQQTHIETTTQTDSQTQTTSTFQLWQLTDWDIDSLEVVFEPLPSPSSQTTNPPSQRVTLRAKGVRKKTLAQEQEQTDLTTQVNTKTTAKGEKQAQTKETKKETKGLSQGLIALMIFIALVIILWGIKRLKDKGKL